jgi:hypothetical protein
VKAAAQLAKIGLRRIHHIFTVIIKAPKTGLAELLLKHYRAVENAISNQTNLPLKSAIKHGS